MTNGSNISLLGRAGAARGRKKQQVFQGQLLCSSSGMEPSCYGVAAQGGCTHQEAGGIIQEAAEAAHEAPFQKGGVFWGQLIHLVGDSRRAETLLPCGREGLGKEQAARVGGSPARAGSPQHQWLGQFAEHSNRSPWKATVFGMNLWLEPQGHEPCTSGGRELGSPMYLHAFC